METAKQSKFPVGTEAGVGEGQPQLQAQAELDAMDYDDIQLALDEVEREYKVRERCFPRWVDEGRISKTDAKDRLYRQLKASKILTLLLDSRSAAV